ncbi:hypothetical protein ACIBQX_11475 [Nonomuraea sp. NPDC049714]|uniref:hypothetical protein n=1 Tax=Nonomuraea sp. NPDC049714 TaxID=3364357 RepID=UPI0037BD573C
MKAYVATSGDPGDYWYSIRQVFSTREAAEAYEHGDNVEEFELLDAPPEVRDWHTITRTLGKDRELQHHSGREDFVGDPDRISVTVENNAHGPHQLIVEGWDLEKVQAAAEDEYVKFLAERDERAAEVVAGLDRIDVRVWYEADGRTVLETPIHSTADHFSVPHDMVCGQAGVDPSQSLHGRWFTVQRLTYTEADGFSVCENPNRDTLRSSSARVDA